MPRKRDQELLRELGGRVADARKARGWTQEGLAEAIQVDPVTLSRWETGSRAVSITTLAAVAEALQVPLGRLLDAEEPLPEPPSPTPEEAELIRVFRTLEPSKQDVLIRLARELKS